MHIHSVTVWPVLGIRLEPVVLFTAILAILLFVLWRLELSEGLSTETRSRVDS